jgi:hypothetical protein
VSAARKRILQFARENPEESESVWREVAAMTDGERRQLMELSESERVAALKIKYRDGASVEVAIAAAAAGDTGGGRMSAPKQTDLADRLAELSITTDELSAIIRRPVEQIEAWVAGETPDPEGKVLLRVLQDDHRATLEAERVRNMQVLPWRGSDWQTADIERAYGTGDSEKQTGGQPQ